MRREGVLRAKGLVIEDEAGRERILIGAPIPPAVNRVRTDESRVRKIWAPRFPNIEEYMGNYQGFEHATNGLVILDENGFDRIAVGDPVPDLNFGKRTGLATGMVINDDQGFERSGYGLLNVNGRYRVNLGLDSDQGEGLVLTLSDDGGVGVFIREGERSLFLGSTPPESWITGFSQAFHGLLLRRGTEVVHQLNVVSGQ